MRSREGRKGPSFSLGKEPGGSFFLHPFLHGLNQNKKGFRLLKGAAASLQEVKDCLGGERGRISNILALFLRGEVGLFREGPLKQRKDGGGFIVKRLRHNVFTIICEGSSPSGASFLAWGEERQAT